jgi:hypothetical protein
MGFQAFYRYSRFRGLVCFGKIDSRNLTWPLFRGSLLIATFLCAIWIIGDTGTKKRCICSVYDDMAKAKDLLNSFEREAVVVKAVVVYLGAEVRESTDGQYTHQFALLPSKRDPKGGVVSIKHNKKLTLEENAVYYVEAEASSERPDNHFGVSIYWLRNPKSIKVVSAFREVERTNG